MQDVKTHHKQTIPEEYPSHKKINSYQLIMITVIMINENRDMCAVVVITKRKV